MTSRNISSFLITWVVVWLALNTEDPDQGDQGDDQLHCLLSDAASTTVPKLDWPCWCWCWCGDYNIKSSKRLTHPYYSDTRIIFSTQRTAKHISTSSNFIMAEPIWVLHIFQIFSIILIIFLEPHSLVFRRHHRHHLGSRESHHYRHQSHQRDPLEIYFWYKQTQLC